MKFKATDDQIKQVMALATNAARPMGMGFLHHDPAHDFHAADFAAAAGLDYVQGRMVKLWINRDRAEPGVWTCPDTEPRSDYQSWRHKYPTWQALLAAAGIDTPAPTGAPACS
jgi:hypothetical protein